MEAVGAGGGAALETGAGDEIGAVGDRGLWVWGRGMGKVPSRVSYGARRYGL